MEIPAKVPNLKNGRDHSFAFVLHSKLIVS
jgi:hypothetical protein